MKKPPRVTVTATITADGKLASGENAAELRGLFEDDRVDDIHLTIRPTIDGRRGAPTLGGPRGEFFPTSVRCRLLKMEVRARECLLHYRVVRPRAKRALKPRA